MTSWPNWLIAVKNNMNQKNTFFLIIGLLILGILVFIFVKPKTNAIPSTKYDEFAGCLASQKLTMYGAVWCSHCQAQKALFGDSFKYVPYVECTENPDRCIAEGIGSYPTWIDNKGVKYIGEQSLEKLGEISGCQLPVN